MALSAATGQFSAHTAGGAPAVALIGRDGTVAAWSEAAAGLLGHRADEVVGRPALGLLAPGAAPCDGGAGDFPRRWSGTVALRRRVGGSLPVSLYVTPLEGTPQFLALATPSGAEPRRSRADSLFRALFDQNRIAMAVHDLSLEVEEDNAAMGLRGSLLGAFDGVRLGDMAEVNGAGTARDHLYRLANGGQPLINVMYLLEGAGPPGREPVLAMTALRLQDADGRPTGVATAVSDVTNMYRTRRRIDLMYDAAANIGSTLDIETTAQQLADVLVPVFGDMASVDIPLSVLAGDEPPPYTGGNRGGLQRVAVRHAHGPWPAALLQPGGPVPTLPGRPDSEPAEAGDHILTSDAEDSRAALGNAALERLLVPEDARQSMGAPLFARGMALGHVVVYRTQDPRVFDEEDARLLREVASRAALSVDNARRYKHEHRTALLLQRSLLPPESTETPAADTSGRYLPAGGSNRVGGDWFDAIALSSLRIALVMGDVTGHGLQATATMARLRTAVQTLADLDVDPDEVLTKLDALVQQIAAEAENPDSIAASCLYAVYDPVTRICRVASAGHPPPAVVRPDGTAGFLDVSPGPLLGVGGLPFEVTETEVEPGSVLALHTNFLTKRHPPPEDGAPGLLERLGTACRPGRSLEDAVRHLLDTAPTDRRTDDLTVLLARTKAVAPGSTAVWEFPPDTAAVPRAREAIRDQLGEWGLDELVFPTELIVSELVTNAIRYAVSPVVLRLTRDQVLLCEVSDASNSQPRMRQAGSTDEGGRGLFLVAQVASRWGSRYRAVGKTIWAEQPIDGC